MTEISVIFTSRGRPGEPPEAVGSLLGQAPTPARSRSSSQRPGRPGHPTAARVAGARCWVAPERYGYTGLHLYLNELAKLAEGAWCQWFNDDMRMQTWNWDTAVRQNRPAILWPSANHCHHANICPAWPKAWSDALGHVTPTTHLDTYLQYLGEGLGRHDRIDGGNHPRPRGPDRQP